LISPSSLSATRAVALRAICAAAIAVERAAIAVALAVATIGATTARAQAPDPGDVAAGMSLFRQKGGCQLCHGWAADGPQDGQPDAGWREPCAKLRSIGKT